MRTHAAVARNHADLQPFAAAAMSAVVAVALLALVLAVVAGGHLTMPAGSPSPTFVGTAHPVPSPRPLPAPAPR